MKRFLRDNPIVFIGIIVLGWLVLGTISLAVDRHFADIPLGLGMARDPSTAKGLLFLVAGSCIVLIGTSLATTLAIAQLLANPHVPASVHRLIRDPWIAGVVGVCMGLAVYCLMIARTVSSEFVPALSVTIALIGSIGVLGVLLFGVRYINQHFQMTTRIAAIARDTLRACAVVYPSSYGSPLHTDPAQLRARWSAHGTPSPVRATTSGYVRSIDLDAIATHSGLRMEVGVAPGDFVTEDDALAVYWSEPHAEYDESIRAAIDIGPERCIQYDPGYGVRQLSDIAVRSLAPDIHDPTTAWVCIRHLQTILGHLGTMDEPDLVRLYDSTDATIITARQTWQDMMRISFGQMMRCAEDPTVAKALLQALQGIVHEVSSYPDRAAFGQSLAVRIGKVAFRQPLPDEDIRAIQRHLDAVSAA